MALNESQSQFSVTVCTENRDRKRTSNKSVLICKMISTLH